MENVEQYPCVVCGEKTADAYWYFDFKVPVCLLVNSNPAHDESEWQQARRPESVRTIQSVNGGAEKCPEALARAIAEAFATDSIGGDTNDDAMDALEGVMSELGIQSQ